MGQMDPLFAEKFIVRELLRAVNHEKIEIPKCIRATHIVSKKWRIIDS